jgi:hypothetical protein
MKPVYTNKGWSDGKGYPTGYEDNAMLPGLREHKQSSLRIAIPDLPPEYLDGVREIVSLESRNPGKGYATVLMWDVCHEADKARMVLILKPMAFANGLDDENLLKFYAKFGFIKTQDDPVIMARAPDMKRYLQ